MPTYIKDPELLAQLDGPKTRTPEEFAKVYGPAASRAAEKLGVDPQIILGQWGLETGWGKSVIPGTNNLGNIKDFSGSGVGATDNMTGSRDKYRAYPTAEAFADDFADLISRKYKGAVGAKDAATFAAALKSGGYAEDPRYADKVVQASRMAGTKQNPILKAVGGAVESVIPSAQAAQRQYISDPAILAQLEGKQPQQAEERESGVMDTAGAAASGFNRGILSRAGLPFNPVDAVANVVDLGKAAIGAPYMAITGKPAPDALTLRPRGEVVGSGEWLINQARKTGVGRAALDAPNPADQGGLVQTLGAGAGGGVGAGASGKQEALNAVMGAGSAGASQVVRDLTGDEALAITAGMTPQAAMRGGVGATKAAVRGGEAGRREMAQRIKDFENAGVENPSVGLASGNRLIQGTENLLASAPGAANVMNKSRNQLLANLEGQISKTADQAAPVRGVRESGTAIQSGLKQFKDDWKNQQAQQWDELGNVIPPQHPTNVGRTSNALADLNAGIPNAPALSKWFTNSKIQALEGALNSDVNAGRTYTPSQIKAALEKNPETAQQLAALLNEGKLPFEAVKKFRTLVGQEIGDTNMLSEISRSKWNPLYGALSEDVRDTAAAVGPQATNAFNRANNFTRAGAGRLEKVAPFADAPTPERAFSSLMSAAKENTSVLQAVKKSLPEDARGTLAATVIERMGKAKPGKQDETGDVWSPETFLTNWNGLSPKSRSELFSGFKDSAAVRDQVEAIAKATAMMRDSASIWANPSGTAPNLSARTSLGGIGLALLTGHPAVAAGGAAVMGGSNLLARGLTSKKMVNRLADYGTNKDWMNADNASFAQQLVNIPGLASKIQQSVDEKR